MRLMMTPDVNVLVAASRSDHPHHQVAHAYLEAALAGCAYGNGLKLMPMVVTSFLRLVTNAKIFVNPTPAKAAMDFLDVLCAVPGVEIPTLGGEWPILRQLCLDGRLTGNSVPDAWLASAVVYLGEHFVTFDADFKKLLKRTQVTILSAL